MITIIFEYIYFEYGAVRVDGYIFPEKVVGDAYYHIVAFTGLNGGIVEYNYENTFSRKTISELLEDLDKADNKEKGIYYNLLKSRFNDDKEEYVEDNQDEILNEYKKVKYSSVTKRMIGDLINKE